MSILPPTTLAERELKYNWYQSQVAWHKRQPPSAWHKQQARWYSRQSRHVFSLTDIVVRTFRKYSTQISRSIAQNNALYNHLKSGKN